LLRSQHTVYALTVYEVQAPPFRDSRDIDALFEVWVVAHVVIGTIAADEVDEIGGPRVLHPVRGAARWEGDKITSADFVLSVAEKHGSVAGKDVDELVDELVHVKLGSFVAGGDDVEMDGAFAEPGLVAQR